MESLRYPSADCSNFLVLFTGAHLKYWLSSTASQFVAEAVMALPEVTAVLITQDNSAAFLILRQQLLQIRLDNLH